MKSVFLDTNILIDLLADRPPFSKFAVEIFDSAEKGTVKLYTSSHSYATTHYLLKKYIGESEMRKLLFALLDFRHYRCGRWYNKKSLLSNHRDFEDAIQIFAANSVDKIDYIITRNLKDFKDTGIKVLPPDELLKRL